jgi:hypothetical protein
VPRWNLPSFESVVEFFPHSLVRGDTVDIKVEQGNYAQCFKILWYRLKVWGNVVKLDCVSGGHHAKSDMQTYQQPKKLQIVNIGRVKITRRS